MLSCFNGAVPGSTVSKYDMAADNPLLNPTQAKHEAVMTGNISCARLNALLDQSVFY